jgi:hypothetical protein
LDLITTINYGAVANVHTLRFTTGCTKSSQSAVSAAVGHLVMAPSTVDAFASVFNRPILRWLATVSHLICKVRVTSRLAVYGHSVRLGVKPIETHTTRVPTHPQLNPCSHSPYVTSSLLRRWVSLMYMLGLFSTASSYIASGWKQQKHCFPQFLFCCVSNYCYADELFTVL